MTTYRLVFRKRAQKSWKKLGASIREQFRKKLIERLGNPHVPSARLQKLPNCYKIKLRSAGYRLIYQVDDDRVVIIVVAIGVRENGDVYEIAAAELRKEDD